MFLSGQATWHFAQLTSALIVSTVKSKGNGNQKPFEKMI